MTLQAFRYALDPTPVQARALASHAGAARFSYNWGLARVKASLDQRAAERSYGITEADLTPGAGWSLPELRKAWNKAKAEVAPWWGGNSKEAYSSGLDNLARGLKNWAASRSAERDSRKFGFPRFKKRGRVRDSFRVTTGSFGPVGDHHMKLPRIGRVKVHEAMRVLTCLVAAEKAKIKSVTVSRTAHRWFVSLVVEVAREVPAMPDGGPVGIDVGVKQLAVLSTGEFVPNPHHLNSALHKLRRVSRAFSRTQRGSVNRRKLSQRLARIHARVANLCTDSLHKLTTRLATSHAVVVIEDLNVAGMIRNRRLARHIADASFGELRRQLAYKTCWYGSTLWVANRFYPSSKTCSACGVVKTKLPLAVRVFDCATCGLVLDRDLNAARNLAQLVRMAVAPSGGETVNACGADRKTELGSAGGSEAGIPHPPGVRREPSFSNGRIPGVTDASRNGSSMPDHPPARRPMPGLTPPKCP